MTNWIVEWSLPLGLAAISCYGMIVLLLSRGGELAVDVPNHRSMHDSPVPRTGGWALLLGCALAVSIAPPALSPPVLAAFGGLLLISVIDDFRHVSAAIRFPVHVAAVALIILALPGQLSWWWYPLLLLAGVWMVNLYNFMDGLDGLAGSMAAIGFATLGLLCLLRGEWGLAGFCGIIVVAALVFLRFNWPPASIFLGDAGSTSLGLAAVAVSLFGWRSGAFGLLAPMVVFAPFWVDATFTLVRRMLARQRWWEAHREHLYQRSALRIGVRRTLHRRISVMVVASLVALGMGLAGLA
ncbi:MraY family glycosyltransferase [Microbulbifer yueqingensis]|uniref:UDP-N-acetylmuramyl pentapeptide phosphotransferase/UDP-N-acetylglucosamine-1-phosphate transferase n=1 Tax=Microbulbifer yueqingensis TaxID=658219 RepID=A0A1G8UGH5_9GAMM|nr:glycosyltransferase family 4 protein [Microbulbifer yueqingensis]SDJ52872.1 UDP-N-acetylmuramyl pentapeptide phosphotransferase/UDP-N-acetylglucosamine-1-phosphate transferase [Microbulbifer yueqingensis]